MIVDIAIGLGVVGLLVGGGYVITHHKPAPTVSGKDLAATISADSLDVWEAIKRDLPEIVSAQVASLQDDLGKAQKDAADAKAALAASVAAHEADIASVAQRVSAALSAGPPPAPTTEP